MANINGKELRDYWSMVQNKEMSDFVEKSRDENKEWLWVSPSYGYSNIENFTKIV